MNFRLLSKVFGVVLFLMAAAQAICYGLTWLEHDGLELVARKAFLVSFLLTFGTGLLLYLLGRKTANEILRKEAIVIVGAGWLLSALFGSLPYMLSAPRMDFAEAFFESMSGFTTTGSTAISDLDVFPDSILLWRSLTQWLGGLGILVLFVAVLSFLGVGSKSLMRHESSFQMGESTTARIHDIAVNLWIIYIAITVITGAGLWIFGMSPFDALNHCLTTVSTGGFSPKDASIAYYDSLAIEIWLIVCMFFSSVSFMLYAVLLRGRNKLERLRVEEEARYYPLLLLGAILIITIDLALTHQELGFWKALRQAAFPVVSISTTTGFGTTNYDEWPTASRMVLMVLMTIGGCAGSTAGGIKMSRFILFFKVAVQEIVRVFRPNQVFSLRINGQSLDESVRLQTMLYLALIFGTIFGASFLVSVLEPSLDISSAFGCTFATLFNIGPGFEVVGPTDNFDALAPWTLIFLSLLMVMGRLEMFVILALFVPALWRKY